LQDTGRSALPAAAAEAVYVDCENERQGMSNGWVDTYAFDREGQDIDITGLPDGLYVVQSIVDPANRLVELHEANNVGIVYFDLQGESVETLEPESVAARMTELNGGTPK
jgi:hypothetical protein